MLNYKIRYTDLNGKKKVVFDFEEDKELLSVFLLCEVTSFEEWIKEAFDKVLSGKSEFEQFNGNVCSTEIHPTTTKIYDMLAEDDEYESTHCEVSTQELRQLIEEWLCKVRELKTKDEQ